MLGTEGFDTRGANQKRSIGFWPREAHLSVSLTAAHDVQLWPGRLFLCSVRWYHSSPWPDGGMKDVVVHGYLSYRRQSLKPWCFNCLRRAANAPSGGSGGLWVLRMPDHARSGRWIVGLDLRFFFFWSFCLLFLLRLHLHLHLDLLFLSLWSGGTVRST